MEFGPKVRIEDATRNQEHYTFTMCNDGWPLTMDNIKMIEGEMQWDLKFPFSFDTCMQMTSIKNRAISK